MDSVSIRIMSTNQMFQCINILQGYQSMNNEHIIDMKWCQSMFRWEKIMQLYIPSNIALLLTLNTVWIFVTNTDTALTDDTDALQLPIRNSTSDKYKHMARVKCKSN